MALAEILLTDSPTTVFAKINAAIDATSALQGEPARAEAAEAGCSALALQVQAQFIAAVGDETNRAEGIEDRLNTQIGDEIDRAEAAEAALAARALLLYGPFDRPGDAAGLFTPSLAVLGDPTTYPALAAGGLVTGAQGLVFRLTGEGYCVGREMYAVEPGRSYAARVGFTRSQNPADPSGDTVRFGLLCYDATRTLIGPLPLNDFDGVTVASGRQSASIALARQPFGANNLPPTTCYVRLYVQVFGGQQATDIEVMRWTDTSDYALLTPDVANLAAALTAEVTRAEAAEAAINPFGARLVADASYTAVVADLGVSLTSLTAPRTITLPLLGSMQRFRPFPIADESGAASAANPITVAPQGGDLINGSPAPVTIETPFQILEPRAGATTWLL